MIILGDKLISEDIFEVKFCCDLEICKGICCIEGDSGAPLAKNELEKLEKNFGKIKEYLSEKNIKAVEKQGFGVLDEERDLGTPLVNHAECAYVTHCGNKSFCAYETAFIAGKTKWKKPISCHLYPIRVVQIGPYKALKYHYWDICDCALKLGKQKNIAVYQFLEEPLIRAFGEEFYSQLCEAAKLYFEKKNKK